MEPEALLQQVQEDIEDDEDKTLGFLMLEKMNYSTQALLESPPRHGGSRQGRSPNLDRERIIGHVRIFKDYFSEHPTFDDVHFRRRYRMRRSLFLKIMNSVCNHDKYFVQRRDAIGLAGLSTIQKATAAIRMLGYGVAADAMDEYCRLGESIAMECLKRFVRAIRELFEVQHLRQPNRPEIEKQLEINKKRGFPRMFASLDCMHYEWKNCPTAWQGQFQDKDKHRSIILEVVADQSLHIWHAYFGLPGSNNDLNVLERSPLVRNLLRSPAEEMHFVVNGTQYPRYYLLTDGIYPKWAIFQQSIHEPQGEKRKHFAMMQESLRKDVERAFGVLQACFAIVSNPCRMWKMADISDILIACVILHNMIIEDEQDSNLEAIINPNPGQAIRRHLSPLQYLDGSKDNEDVLAHFSLKNNLIEHLWQVKGDRDMQ